MERLAVWWSGEKVVEGAGGERRVGEAGGEAIEVGSRRIWLVERGGKLVARRRRSGEELDSIWSRGLASFLALGAPVYPFATKVVLLDFWRQFWFSSASGLSYTHSDSLASSLECHEALRVAVNGNGRSSWTPYGNYDLLWRKCTLADDQEPEVGGWSNILSCRHLRAPSPSDHLAGGKFERKKSAWPGLLASVHWCHHQNEWSQHVPYY